MKATFALAAIGLLVACVETSDPAPALPGRDTFAFFEAREGATLFYACTASHPGGSQEARAEAAHRFFLGRVRANREVFRSSLSRRIAAAVAAGPGAPPPPPQPDLVGPFMARMTTEMDGRFGCVPVEPSGT